MHASHPTDVQLAQAKPYTAVRAAHHIALRNAETWHFQCLVLILKALPVIARPVNGATDGATVTGEPVSRPKPC
jgi:hypothetical protein